MPISPPFFRQRSIKSPLPGLGLFHAKRSGRIISKGKDRILGPSQPVVARLAIKTSVPIRSRFTRRCHWTGMRGHRTGGWIWHYAIPVRITSPTLHAHQTQRHAQRRRRYRLLVYGVSPRIVTFTSAASPARPAGGIPQHEAVRGEEREGYHRCSASSTACGWDSATRSSARAVPSGRRWPCSQFWRVRGLMPMSAAN